MDSPAPDVLTTAVLLGAMTSTVVTPVAAPVVEAPTVGSATTPENAVVTADGSTDAPAGDGKTSNSTTTEPAAMLVMATWVAGTPTAAATSALKEVSNVVHSGEPAAPATVSRSPASVRVATTFVAGGGGGVSPTEPDPTAVQEPGAGGEAGSYLQSHAVCQVKGRPYTRGKRAVACRTHGADSSGFTPEEKILDQDRAEDVDWSSGVQVALVPTPRNVHVINRVKDRQRCIDGFGSDEGYVWVPRSWHRTVWAHSCRTLA